MDAYSARIGSSLSCCWILMKLSVHECMEGKVGGILVLSFHFFFSFQFHLFY